VNPNRSRAHHWQGGHTLNLSLFLYVLLATGLLVAWTLAFREV